MAEILLTSTGHKKTALAEQLWLAYFNSYLYENGMITETERNRMSVKIQCRKRSASNAKERDQ